MGLMQRHQLISWSQISRFSVQHNTIKAKRTTTCSLALKLKYVGSAGWEPEKSNELDSLSALCKHGWTAPNWLISKSLGQFSCYAGAGMNPCVQQHVNMQPHPYAQTLSSSGLQLHCSFSATHVCFRAEQAGRNYPRYNQDDGMLQGAASGARSESLKDTWAGSM